MLVETKRKPRHRRGRTRAAPADSTVARSGQRFALAFTVVLALATVGGLAVSWSNPRSGVVLGVASLAPLPAGPVQLPAGAGFERTAAGGDPLAAPLPGSERIVPPRAPGLRDTPPRPRARTAAPEPVVDVTKTPEPAVPPAVVALAPLPAVATPESRPDLASQLAACSRGEWFERFVCDQRTRLRYCEGRWGQVAECPGAGTGDHGQ